jgi:FKBP-type peptidyl-prolyl cis-trans isomerase
MSMAFSLSLRTALRASLLLVPLALLGCGDDLVEPDDTGPKTPADVEFDPALNIVLEDMTILESGLYIQTLVEGDPGEDPVTEGSVLVDYTLWLPNGTRIDSSAGREPLRFNLGEGEVIPGFDEGVSGMRVGEVRRILVPSEMGYGSRPNGAIPANSVLVFEVELISAP